MGYTNGYNYSEVRAALLYRLGWRNSTQVGYADLVNTDNEQALSNRHFNDFHALVTIPVLKDVQEDPDIDDEDFNDYLVQQKDAVIMRCLNGVLNSREIFEQVLLFDRFGQNDTLVENSNQFVGYEINIARAFDRAVQIDGAVLQFNEDKNFNLYLFKDGKKTPIIIIPVSCVAYEQTQIEFPELILTYINANTRGGRFYFGYFQSDLGTAKAIREQIIHRNSTYNFGANPVMMTKNIDYTFNQDQRSYTIEPYGLNLEMSSFKDWTQIIVKKAPLFDELIGLTMAYVVLEQIVHSVRSNGTERLAKDVADKYNLMFSMDGAVPVSDTPQVAGLKQRIDREMKRVNKELIPCPKAVSVNVAGCSY